MKTEEKFEFVEKELKAVIEIYDQKKETYIQRVMKDGLTECAALHEGMVKYQHKAQFARNFLTLIPEIRLHDKPEEQMKERLEKVMRTFEDRTLLMARNPTYSTSPVENFNSLVKTAVYAELAEYIDDVLLPLFR